MERGVAEQARALNAARSAMSSHTAAPSVASELADALVQQRMTVYLEPIQQIAGDQPRHYEVSVRFKTADGAELPHEELLAAARSSGLLAQVDAAILPRAARIAQHFQARGRETDVVSRVHGESLADQEFRSGVTAATIAADGAALVLSFAQSDVRAFGRLHWEILSTLSDMGLRFAIESITDLDMDFEMLEQRGFTFAKLDAEVLLNGLPAMGGVIAPADVCRHLAMMGLALVVGHVDDEAVRARLLGFGVLFGQGTLFGGRRAVRADILTAAMAA
jgi:cyclic-di-GMP phosphodiesterase, flagellum assembly factor TipF